MNRVIDYKPEQLKILRDSLKKWRISLFDIALESEYSESMCSQVLRGKIRVTDNSDVIIAKALRLIHDAKERSRKRNEEMFEEIK